MNLLEERTVALAGILQAAEQVQKLARSGEGEQDVIDTALRSILILDAANTPSVFGGLEGVSNGLRLIADSVLASAQGEHVELLRYGMSLLTLQSQLMRDQSKFTDFGTDVERLSGVPADELPGACSKVYQQYISQLQPQIIVQGEQDFLQREDIPVKIRSLLLAGIRAAVLWQQKGGGRFKLIWERTRMRNTARSLLHLQVTH